MRAKPAEGFFITSERFQNRAHGRNFAGVAAWAAAHRCFRSAASTVCRRMLAQFFGSDATILVMRMRSLFLGLGALPVLWFAYMAFLKNGGEHAYRLTIVVDTPSGTRSGSSVIRVFQDTRKGGLPNTGGGRTLTGEGIFLDLGSGKNLAALLPDAYLVERAFGTPDRLLTVQEVQNLAGKVELRRELIPAIISFENLADPASARQLYGVGWRQTPPQGVVPVVTNAFNAVLGSGYALRSASVEIVPVGIWPLNRIGITGEPVTQGIEKHFPWWGRPLPWLRRISSETYVDTRPLNQFKWSPDELKRDGVA